MNVFKLQKDKLKTHIFGQEGVATVFKTINLCFAICEELSFLGGPFWANFGWYSENTLKVGIQHMFKSKTSPQKLPFSMVINWSK